MNILKLQLFLCYMNVYCLLNHYFFCYEYCFLNYYKFSKNIFVYSLIVHVCFNYSQNLHVDLFTLVHNNQYLGIIHTMWNALAQLNFLALRNLSIKASSVRTCRFFSAVNNQIATSVLHIFNFCVNFLFTHYHNSESTKDYYYLFHLQ